MATWRRNQLTVTAVSFVGFTGFTLVMPFLPLYIQQLGVTDVGDVAMWTGVTLGITPAITAICSPFWGRIADRFGNKILVQRSLVGFVVVMAAMAYATAPWQLFVLRALLGFVAGYGPLTLSMAALSVPRERMAQAIGAVQTAHRLGPALGPVIGGALAPLVGLRNAFLVSAGVYACALVMVTAFYTEPPRPPKDKGPEKERVTFGSILTLENFLLSMLVIFGLQMVDRSFGPVLPLHLDAIGYSREQVPVMAGVLFSALAFSAAFGNQLSGVLLKRATPRAVIGAAVLVAAGALALFASVRGPWLLTMSLTIVGLCIGTATTTAYTAAGSVIPREVHGTAFGLLTGASLVGLALSPVISGLVAARSIRVVFVVGVVGLVGLAAGVRRLMVNRPLHMERDESGKNVE